MFFLSHIPVTDTTVWATSRYENSRERHSGLGKVHSTEGLWMHLNGVAHCFVVRSLIMGACSREKRTFAGVMILNRLKIMNNLVIQGALNCKRAIYFFIKQSVNRIKWNFCHKNAIVAKLFQTLFYYNEPFKLIRAVKIH